MADRCPHCGGSGLLQWHVDGAPFGRPHRCQFCNGTGRDDWRPPSSPQTEDADA